MRAWPGRVHNGRTITYLALDRRESAVLVVDSGRTLDAGATLPCGPGSVVQELAGPWSADGPAGRHTEAPCPGDWAHAAGWETFSGTVRFRTEFSLAAGEAEAVDFIDLGRVGDIAEVVLNGKRVGVRGWAPYRFVIAGACRQGRNTVEVVVTNSMANEYDGLQMESGLVGPVALRAAAPPAGTVSS